jgi:hypothetical protein
VAALTRKKDEDDKTAGSGTERTGQGAGSADEQARSDQGPPEPPASSFVVKVEDHEVDVDVKDGPGSVDDGDWDRPRSIEGISAENFSKLYRAMIDENARRGMLPESRPFADIDKESLLILSNQLRGELASR